MQNEQKYPSSNGTSKSFDATSLSTEKAPGIEMNPSALDSLSQEATKLTKALNPATSEDLKKIGSQLSAVLDSAKQSISQAGVAVREKALQSSKATDVYVRDQPWRAVAFSALAAVIFGFVLGRRR